MVNQHVSTICIKVKRNQEKNKTKSEDKIIRYISNLSKQEENLVVKLHEREFE